ncbi:ABC transporter permease [Myroides ceti]|uniref:ABC transporter permease n=1 Tax=Paenimyroides ceti TaxID=395087 RepID=A0ABT8D2I4_9FLAO|nr:ABC transporter permease [Paenimyroides ceti]MDN3709522.1 ABC transporter permease [Paenimyroides ceti]
MNRISNFFNAYRTEGIKLKNTNILTTALILSVFLPLILFITGIFSEDVYQTTAKEVNIVTENFSNLKKSFIQFFYCIIMILSASRISQIEFKNNTWQLIETQPLYKTSIYFEMPLHRLRYFRFFAKPIPIRRSLPHPQFYDL